MPTAPSTLTATDVARAFDPSRLEQARRFRAMTKTDVHRLVGVSAAAVGQYERGEIVPRAETITALASALDVPISFFTLGRPAVRVEVAEASFRRLRSTTVGQQQQATAYAELVWELSRYLEQFVEFPDVNLPDWAHTESEDAPDPVSAARLMRSYWHLGTEPIPHLVYQLEQHGILTVLFSMKEDELDPKRKIDAFSISSLPRPIIVLTPDKADDVLRHRFSAAHELGHIVLHHGRHGSDTQMERDADAFAAEFLTPRDTIQNELPRRVNLARLEAVSQRWGVSIHSLLYRCKELEFISESTYRRAWITLNTVKPTAQPIRDFPGERPELMRNALALLHDDGTSIAAIAEALRVSVKIIRRLADIDEPPAPRLSLVRSSDDADRHRADPITTDHEQKGGTTMSNRSSISGRYISNAAAARHPRTSVTESGANRTSATQHRSAITGHYITPAAAARHPHTSITENKK
ncbi:DNA-binding protein [Rathayibacter sp. AY1B7]|uniref:helix-turn-helix domain-containing protein n=1 Tax=Rathayibacter sp. AY1B7 TaxID=2080532 RepID=UPI000CE75E2E|nr:ImmA/IrrE family metallo-endopeptidase [Rathayibacter sp. AY1B7]PPH96004.1 DNA-binding protein [Rathayibacter sp. AY1B7]